MSLPLAKSEQTIAPRRDDTASAPVITRPAVARPDAMPEAESPARNLQANLEKAFMPSDEVAPSEISKVPFVLTLIGVTIFSGMFWTLVAMLLHAF